MLYFKLYVYYIYTKRTFCSWGFILLYILFDTFIYMFLPLLPLETNYFAARQFYTLTHVRVWIHTYTDVYVNVYEKTERVQRYYFF